MGIHKLTRTETAQLAGVSLRSISNWLLEGLPQNEDGSFSGPRVVQWLVSRVEDKVAGAGMPAATVEAQRWLTKFREERARLAEIERKRVEEKLISRDEASQEWAGIVSAVMSSLEIFADRLPPVLIGRNRVEMFEIIRDEIWELPAAI